MAKKLHIKPTKEELEAKVKEAEEKLDKTETKETPVLKDNQEKAKEQDVVEESPEKEVKSKPKVDDGEEKIPQKEPDYKKRYADSTREAQILHAKNKKIMEAVEKAKEIPDPTEEELKTVLDAMNKNFWDVAQVSLERADSSLDRLFSPQNNHNIYDEIFKKFCIGK